MAATFTSYFNLAKPATGDLDWGPEVDGNFDVIATTMRATLEDRHLRFMGGGTLLYDALTGLISFSEDIVIHHGVTGFVSTIPVTESPLTVSSAFRQVYINITRDPQVNEVISVGNGNLFSNQLVTPGTNTAYLFALRDNHTPTNRVILPFGHILEDGLPGNLNQGSETTLQAAYDSSVDGTIRVDDIKPLAVLGADVPTDSIVQSNIVYGTDDQVLYPTPTYFAIQFVTGAIADISRLAMRLSLVGAPAGNWQYRIIKDLAGLPSTAGPDLLYTSANQSVSSLPVIPAAQYIAGSPTLVTLVPGTYWFVLTVDGAYQGSADAFNHITVARATGGGLPLAATFHGITTLWTASANKYYNEIFKTAPGDGPALLTLTSTGDGEAAIGAPFVTTKDVTHTLAFTGLKSVVVDQINATDTIILDSVESLLTVAPGDDLYLRDTTNLDNIGLYRVLTITVNTPVAQTTIVIDQTAGLEILGYNLVLTTETPGSATVDILRVTDTNRLFQIKNELGDDLFEVDSARSRVTIDGDLLVKGKQVFIDTETKVSETLLVKEALSLSSQILFQVDNTGSAGDVARFRQSGADAFRIPYSAGAELSRHLLFPTDNTYDIGADGATRPRSIYAGTGVSTAGFLVTERLDVASAATIAALSSSKSFVKVTGATVTDIQGVAARSHQRLLIHNAATAVVTLKHDDAGATAVDRLNLPNAVDILLNPGTSAELVYDSGQSRWVIGSSGTGTKGIVTIGLAGSGADFIFDGTAASYHTAADDPRISFGGTLKFLQGTFTFSGVPTWRKNVRHVGSGVSDALGVVTLLSLPAGTSVGNATDGRYFFQDMEIRATGAVTHRMSFILNEEVRLLRVWTTGGTNIAIDIKTGYYNHIEDCFFLSSLPFWDWQGAFIKAENSDLSTTINHGGVGDYTYYNCSLLIDFVSLTGGGIRIFGGSLFSLTNSGGGVASNNRVMGCSLSSPLPIWFTGYFEANSNQGGDTQYRDLGNLTGSTALSFEGGRKQLTLAFTLTGNLTITAFSNQIPGRQHVLKVIQDGTGGRTITWPGSVTWISGSAPTLSSAAGAIDFIVMFYDGTTLYGYKAGSSGSQTYTVIAGEALTANDAVYISVGGADGGRTLGQAYKLDATNDNRSEYAGMVVLGVGAAATVAIQVGGELLGFAGLTVGEPVYGSVTTPGAFQVTPPSTIGQWAIQLGTAKSASALIINGAGSATAIKITAGSSNSGMAANSLVESLVATVEATVTESVVDVLSTGVYSYEQKTVFLNSVSTPLYQQLIRSEVIENVQHVTPGMGVDNDFHVWTSGLNTDGQLGDDTTSNRSSPVSVVGTNRLVTVSRAPAVTVALDDQGYAWAFGKGTDGTLGQGTVAVNRSSPVSVVGAIVFVAIDASADHAAAIDYSGYAWAWGAGASGQLGESVTAVDRSSPMSVVGGKAFVAIAAGSNSNAAIDTKNTVWTWGSNSSGQLGDNTTTSRSSPVSMRVSGVMSIRGGANGANTAGTFLMTNDTGYAFTVGDNSSGQLGDNTTTNRSSPVSVVGGKKFYEIANSGTHCLGLDRYGHVWAWGSNVDGQLGDNTTTSRSSPVSINSGPTKFLLIGAFVDANGGSSAAIDMDGYVWAWGYNGQGQLGDNTTTSRSSPVSVTGGRIFKTRKVY